MHYNVAVLIPGGATDVEAEVRHALEPHEGKHWDWYVIGGRWHGWVTRTERSTNQYESSLDGNVARAAEVSLEHRPACVVTPDGEWVELVGWGNEDDATRAKSVAKWRAILEANPTALVVGVDCHN